MHTNTYSLKRVHFLVRGCECEVRTPRLALDTCDFLSLVTDANDSGTRRTFAVPDIIRIRGSFGAGCTGWIHVDYFHKHIPIGIHSVLCVLVCGERRKERERDGNPSRMIACICFALPVHRSSGNNQITGQQ